MTKLTVFTGGGRGRVVEETSVDETVTGVGERGCATTLAVVAVTVVVAGVVEVVVCTGLAGGAGVGGGFETTGAAGLSLLPGFSRASCRSGDKM